jgi:hypothetical protein
MESKQIVYFYDSLIKANETQVDVEGDLLPPIKGDILLRPDKKWWKVEHTRTRHDGGNALPVHEIYLVPAEPR